LHQLIATSLPFWLFAIGYFVSFQRWIEGVSEGNRKHPARNFEVEIQRLGLLLLKILQCYPVAFFHFVPEK